MVSQVFSGRYTASIQEPFAVFLIGLRINRLRSLTRWWPVLKAMPTMMQVLQQHPEKGLLGSETFCRVWPIEILMLSYWRSFEDLERFARDQDDPHWGAWQAFMRDSNNGSVGIWHETYLIEPGHYECIYGNMPKFGLAAATRHITVSEKLQTARKRTQCGRDETSMEQQDD